MLSEETRSYFKSFDDRMAASAEAAAKKIDQRRNYFNSFPRGWVKAHQMLCRNLGHLIAQQYDFERDYSITLYNFIKKLTTDPANYVLSGNLLANAIRVLKIDTSVFNFDLVLPSTSSLDYSLQVGEYAKLCSSRPVNEKNTLWLKNPFEEKFLQTARSYLRVNGQELEAAHCSLMRYRRIEGGLVGEITAYEYKSLCKVLNIKETLYTPEYVIPQILPRARPNGVNRKFYRKKPAVLSADSLTSAECAAIVNSLQEEPKPPVLQEPDSRQDLLIRKSHYAGSVRLAGAMEGRSDRLFALDEFAKIVDPFCETINIDSLTKMVSIMNCDFVNAINTNLDVSISPESKTVWVALQPVKFKIVRNDNKLVIDLDIPQDKLPELETKLSKFLIDNVA